jgi:CHAT domain-containing protein/tetratricopeptide (TPR) repeat protein
LTLGEHLETSKTMSNLGDCLCKANDHDEGLRQLHRALDIKTRLAPDAKLSLSFTQVNLSACFYKKGELGSAIQSAENALQNQMAAHGNDDQFADVADSHSNLGAMYEDWGDYHRSLEHYRAALRIRIALGQEKSRGSADLYNNFATWHIAVGNFASAITFLEKAQQIHENEPEPDSVRMGRVLLNLGNCYGGLGQYQKALDCEMNALTLLASAPNNLSLAYRNIGASFKNLREYDKALDFYQKALDRADADNIEAAWLNDAMAVCYRYKKDMPKAISLHQKAIKIAQGAFSYKHPDLAAFHHDLGLCFAEIKDWPQARKQHEQALAIRWRSFSGVGTDVASSLAELGRVCAAEGRHRLADSLFQASKTALGYAESFVFDSVRSIPRLLAVLKYQAANYQEWGREALQRKSFDTWREAVAAAGHLFQNRFLLRQNLLEAGSFAEFLDQIHEACGSAIATALRLYHQSGEHAWLSEAFDMSERAKAFQLRHLALETDWMGGESLPPELALEERRLREHYASAERLRQELRKSGMSEDDPKLLALSVKIYDLKKSYERNKLQIKEACPPCFEKNFGLPIVGENALKAILGDNQALIEFFEGDSTTYLFVLGSNFYQVFEIPRPASNPAPQNMVSWLLKSADQNEPDKDRATYLRGYTHAAFQLFEQLLSQAWPFLSEKKQLIIVPDGSISLIPFEALLVERPAAAVLEAQRFNAMQFLMRSKTASYAASATMLVSAYQQAHEIPAHDTVFCMAPFVSGEREYKRSGLGNLILANLPNTSAEVLAVQEIMGGTVFVGAEANSVRFRSLAERYRFIHLALHAGTEPKVGENAFLAFYDSLLYLRDIANLNLRSDMVVLSGCKTALGEIRPGEGLVGISWAFARAGAKSVFSTLWEVEDLATKALAEPFYKNLRKGMPKDEALQKAKMSLLFSQEFGHPAYWAAMVGHGEMRPIW